MNQDSSLLSPKQKAYSIDVCGSPYKNGNADLLYDADSIEQSLRNLTVGYIGCKSRIFNQTFGSQTYDFIGEPLDDRTAAAIRTSLLQSIGKWEPRVSVTASNLTVIPKISVPGYLVVISYVVLATSSSETTSFNIKL